MRLLDRAWTDPKTREAFKVVQITVRPEDPSYRKTVPVDVADLLMPFEITPIARYYDRQYPNFSYGTVNWNEIVDQLRPPGQMTFWEYVREPGTMPDLHPSIEAIGVFFSLTPPDDAGYGEEGLRLFRELTRHSAHNVWTAMRRQRYVTAAAEPAFEDIQFELEYEIFALHDRVRVSKVSKGNLYLTADSRPFMVRYHDDSSLVPLHFFSQTDVTSDLMTQDGLHALINPALLAMSMLNTKNVSPVILPAQEVPAKIAEKRRRKAGRDPFVYRTLSITPMGGGYVRRKGGGEERDADPRRLHIARGHFKRFTPQAPLFGRHVGTYWWNSQVRGDIAAGAVVKDYAIKQPKQKGN